MYTLFECMKPYLDTATSTAGITIDELNHRIKEVLSIRDNLHSSITDLSAQLEHMTSNMEWQISIILGMEGQCKESFTEFSLRIKELYDYIKHTSTPHSASTSKQVHWGSTVK
jgi:hypothetical protein